MSDWTDRIVGDRMAVDREFESRVRDSEFSNQEWGMIMTAVEFEIADPGDPEAARVVADTSKISQVLPALDEVQDGMAQLGGAPGGGSGGSSGSGGSGGGIFGSIKSALGMGGGGGGDSSGADPREAAAASLAQEYAERLQARLESQGKWEEVRTLAAD